MAFALLALTSLAATPQASVMPAHASATASIRIVLGARVHLGPATDRGEQALVRAAVRIEDGSRRPALLVEFQ